MQVEAESVAQGGLIDVVLDWVRYMAIAIEVLAVAIIVLSILVATITHLSLRVKQGKAEVGFRGYRAQLGSGLLLGLEILVAADVIRTVALEQTLESVTTLGVLVLIRIFLAWSIVVEIERRWPWQPASYDETQSDIQEGG
ncbi:MAG TPA: DUF1622 domain-containing protein [Thermomicrobiales bacterium]|nr:DUF1622 domain-containing protein [Thermomicrobiales bacterium]